MRKRITALALEGDRLVLFDNLEGKFGNATLDAALTGTSWKDRLLGHNRQVSVPLWASWYATGNNVACGRIGASQGAKQAKIEASIKTGGTVPVINKGGRPQGVPQKVTPTLATMILKMKAEKRKVAVAARELQLSRQTVHEVLKRA